MKVETRLFGFLSLLYIPIGVAYGIMTHWHEPLGYLALFLTSAMSGLITFYLNHTGRHTDPRPEDDPHGEIRMNAGEQGFFPPYSWWPLPLGFGCALLFAGLAAGWWLFIIAIPVVAVSVVGWVFEYYRGDFAH